MSAKVIQLVCSRDKSFHLLGSYQLFSNTLTAKQTKQRTKNASPRQDTA